jgi:sortase A
MTQTNGPVIVRHEPKPPSYVKPGLHSHNVRRRLSQVGRKLRFLRGLRGLLLLLGLCGVGYYGYTLADQYVYQTYENWAFDQQIAGRAGVTFSDYLRERTPFGFLAGPAPAKPTASTAAAPATPSEASIVRPAEGALLGRVEIGRLNLSAIVREGVDTKTLSSAVGHVPSTALPGQLGNFAIAAHRDTLFRALKDIHKDDLVTFQSPGATYSYKVVATKIVVPSDVSVLRSDGGGIIPANDPPGQAAVPSRLLTMITCYPFYYVGAAPKRFIVEAELVSNHPGSPPSDNLAPPPAHPTPSASPRAPATPTHTRRPTHLRRVQRAQTSTSSPPRKRGFWHRLFHVS